MQTIGIEKQLIRFLTNPSFSLCRGDLAENNLYPPEIRLDPVLVLPNEVTKRNIYRPIGRQK